MRASRTIVAGRFCGGEIEPGTFHGKHLVRRPGGATRSLHTADGRHGAGISACRSSVNPALGKDAMNASASRHETEVPAARG